LAALPFLAPTTKKLPAVGDGVDFSKRKACREKKEVNNQ
jgi:hypothetical protein